MRTKTFFGQITAVSVGNQPLKESNTDWNMEEGTFYSSEFGTAIIFGSDILKEGESVTITIQATGYEDLVIILNPNGEIVTEKSTELAAAKVKQDDTSAGEAAGEPEQDDASVDQTVE